MKSAVIVFPGSNCDRDVETALAASSGHAPAMVWHRETRLPKVDLIVLPGGFSYGDYLRAGAIAARSPVMAEVVAAAGRGIAVLGICNGFQLLTECGLLPGVLMRNRGLTFVCRDAPLRVDGMDSVFTGAFAPGAVVRFPIAHHDGNYFADPDTLDRLEGDGRVLFRYADDHGQVSDAANPNGAQRNIAGVTDAAGRVLGLMPHPERAADPIHGGPDGRRFFDGLVGALS